MFYRTLLAAFAAIVIASPVFADDTASTTGSADTSMQTTDNSAATQTKVNLNTATYQELKKVTNSSAKAHAIISYRKKNGDFKSVDDIANVKGFKKMNADKMKAMTDQFTVE